MNNSMNQYEKAKQMAKDRELQQLQQRLRDYRLAIHLSPSEANHEIRRREKAAVEAMKQALSEIPDE